MLFFRSDSGGKPTPVQWVARSVLAVTVGLAFTAAVLAAAGWLPAGLLWSVLAGQHDRFVALTAAYPVLSALLFALVYSLGVTFSMPGAVWMTLLGGYLFGPVWGAGLVFVAATGGAVAVFLLARTAWGGAGGARMESLPGIAALTDGLRDHAFSTLLAARLLPVLPFWVVNLIPALIGVRLRVFVVATALGIVPGTLIYVSLGAGLADMMEQPDPDLLFRPDIFLPLLGLAVLALLPVLWRKRRMPPPGA